MSGTYGGLFLIELDISGCLFDRFSVWSFRSPVLYMVSRIVIGRKQTCHHGLVLVCPSFGTNPKYIR